MSLWDEKVNKVSEGKVINIKNGFVSLHRGSMRLTLGREGEIRESNVEIGEVNNKVNLSDKVLRKEEGSRGSNQFIFMSSLESTLFTSLPFQLFYYSLLNITRPSTNRLYSLGHESTLALTD